MLSTSFHIYQGSLAYRAHDSFLKHFIIGQTCKSKEPSHLDWPHAFLVVLLGNCWGWAGGSVISLRGPPTPSGVLLPTQTLWVLLRSSPNVFSNVCRAFPLKLFVSFIRPVGPQILHTYFMYSEVLRTNYSTEEPNQASECYWERLPRPLT